MTDSGDLMVDCGDSPQTLEVLPDGTDTVVSGDVARIAEFNHQQGDNAYGFTNDCGLVSSQDVLNQFGIDVTEGDVVDHAVSNNECQIQDSPGDSGGTTTTDQVKILGDYGVGAHVQQGGSLESLAQDVEQGRGTIAEVNAGVLWNDPSHYDTGGSNHAITVTGVARDPETGGLQGFFINDSGTGDSGRFVDAATMEHAWSDTGAQAVVTDGSTSAAAPPNAGLA